MRLGLLSLVMLLGCPGAPTNDGGVTLPDAGPVEPLDGGRWLALRGLPQARQECGVVALAGFVYVVGGFGPGDQPVPDVLRLDVAAGAWARVSPLPRPLHHPNVGVVRGQLYVVGALEGAGFTATGEVFRYDPPTDTWTRRSSMPNELRRGAAAVGVLGDEIYLAGGYRQGSTSQVSVYSPLLDAHRELTSLPESTEHVVGAVVDGRFFVIGGRRGDVHRVTGRVTVFDVASGSWSELAPLPTPRGGHAVAVLGRRLVVIGGEGNAASPTGVFGQTELFDVDSQRWFSGPPMTTPRHGTGAATVGDLVIVPGGGDFEGFAGVSVVEGFTLSP